MCMYTRQKGDVQSANTAPFIKEGSLTTFEYLSLPLNSFLNLKNSYLFMHTRCKARDENEELLCSGGAAQM